MNFVNDINIFTYDFNITSNCRVLKKMHAHCETWKRRHEIVFALIKYRVHTLLLLLNSYSLWHCHQTIYAKVFTCLNRKKNFIKEEKSLVFNFIAAKSSLTNRRWFVATTFMRSLCCSFVSNTKNRLRDKLNESEHELLQTFFNKKIELTNWFSSINLSMSWVFSECSITCANSSFHRLWTRSVCSLRCRRRKVSKV